MIRRFCCLFLPAFCLLLLAFADSGAETGSATTHVKSVLDRAMEIQARPELSGDAHKKERSKLVRQLIAENFLSAEMARASLAGTWETISQAQRSQFQNLFAILFQDSYTRQVLNFLRNETIEYRPESSDSKGTRVPTVILRPNEHIPVDYFLVKRGAKWLIRDVAIDGVSIVENYTNTFRRFIQRQSFDALLGQMSVQTKVIADD